MAERELSIDDQALDWVARQKGRGLTETEEAGFRKWYAASPRHRGAYLRASALWVKLDDARLGDLSTDNLLKSNITRRRVLWGLGSAAAASGAVVGLGVWHKDRLSTRRGERQQIPLSDRSLASLNSASELQIKMSTAERRVRLLAGEAWFDVAKNPDRPFIVEVGPLEVRAVGTAFSVRQRGDGVDVVVTEGTVELSGGNLTEATRLEAGSGAFVPDRSKTVRLAAKSEFVERKLAWREGKVDLQEDTLEDAVAEFNRYNEIELEITDPSLRKTRLVGVYRLNDPEGFAHDLELLLGVTVTVMPEKIRINASNA